jgi:hypothetical protein
LRQAPGLLALAVLTVASASAAQEPVPPPSPDLTLPAPDFGSLGLPTDPAEQALGQRRQHYRAACLLLGVANTGRTQAVVFEEDGCTCLVEMNDGGALTPFAVVGVAAGGRLGFAVAGDGVRSGLVVGPGVDVWANSPVHEAVLAPTLDFKLLYAAGPQGRWDLGLNLGAGYYYGRGADYGFPRLFPLVGLSTALRF